MTTLSPVVVEPNFVVDHDVVVEPNFVVDHKHVPPRTAHRRFPWSALGLLAVLAGQVALAVVPRRNGSPFEDEGLYIYMGHRMIDHLLHGAHLTEYPGAYFSGAPGFYPVLAAVGDSVGGLNGARAVSLLFALAATVCVHGLGRALYGRRAGLLGAAAFVFCGSVIFQSWLATFDSTAMAFVAGAGWLTVRSVRRDDFLWAPAVSLLLVCAFTAKYGAVVYVPVTGLLAVAVGLTTGRPVTVVIRRAVVMMLGTAIVAFALYSLWGQSLRDGIVSTTVNRRPINPSTPVDLAEQVGQWVGWWLLLAVVGALLARRSWPVSVVLLVASVIAPLQQIRIGELTSLSKHVAFGMVFACPLIGLALATASRRLRWITTPLVVAVLVLLCLDGSHWSNRFLNGWVPDDALVPTLATLADASPGKTILGDQPSPERYQLREQVSPMQWTDTYSFSYDHRTGMPAYEEAIQQTAFGVIYLEVRSNTDYGRQLSDYLLHTETPYKEVATVRRTLYGKPAGLWVLYMPKVTPTPTLPEIGGASPGGNG